MSQSQYLRVWVEREINTVKFAVIIMAAGKGTRLKSKRPKVLHEIGGSPLLTHVISSAAQLVLPEDIFVVIGHEAEQVKNAVASTGVRFVLQTEQRGTGHAIQCAAPYVTDYDHLLILSGDVPLIRTETIRELRDFHLQQRAAMTIVTATPEDPHGYGRVVRSERNSVEVVGIVEQKALTPDQEYRGEINSGIYAFNRETLVDHLGELQADNAQAEYYLTDMAGLLVAANQRVLALPAERAEEVLGANTIVELVALDATLRTETAKRLMSSGVTIFKPETCVIDAAVKVAPDTIIEPFVQLLGKTTIGENCRIRSYSVLENATLGDNVVVRQGCVILGSEVGNGALLGPYSHIRPESFIGEKAHIGNFVETKKVRIGAGSKANHLTYLGDAEVGSGTNIGAGVITCNYDGVNKFKTEIGNQVFVGSDSTLIAPISIGDGAYVAAGSCITDDVPPDSLALGRARQVTKPEWVSNRRAQVAAAKETR
jgi:bifunctional UDP-N-acetylglucosamine pyrophosphorylase / glucosamine-1-phosphate N-acetyltransferase